jgi:hypothetical protein
MMRSFLIAALLVGSAIAQTTTTVTGTIKDLTGALVTSGKVTFTLTPGRDTAISGVARFSPQTIVCLINGSGLIKAQDGTSTCTLTMNTALQPTGTYYTVAVWPGNVKTSTFTFYAVLSSYDWSTVVPTPTTSPAQNFVDVFSNQTIGGNKIWTGTQTFQTPLSIGSFNDMAYVDGSLFVTVQAAIDSFGSNPGVVIVPPSYVGSPTTSASIPDNVAVWDYTMQGRVRVFVNPSTSPAGSACGFFVSNAPASFTAGNPAVNNCVMYYGAAETSNAQPTQWGQNVVLQAGPAVTGGVLTGYEADVNPTSSTAGTHGALLVAGGNQQATGTQDAVNCFTASNTFPVGGWKTCLTVNGVTNTVFAFAAKDTGLQITQAITSSGSPQTVSTNGNCTVLPFSQLYVGSLLAVDSGGTQEDVTISNASCVSGVAKITAIFSQNHANPTSIYEYGAQRIWDASPYVTNTIPYVWGNLQNYNTSNTPNVLSFGVYDSAGVLRVGEYFSSTGQRNWRDVGTTGFGWQSQAAASLMTLSDAGTLAVVNNATVGGTLGIGSIAFASLPSAGNGVIMYCSNCKNVVDDAVSAGVACVGSGHGAIAKRENGRWDCN